MTKAPHNIRQLEEKDLVLHAEHTIRVKATSGLPPTPKFTGASRFDLPQASEVAEKNRRLWSLPIGTPGWIRCFGYFDDAGLIRGEVGMRTHEQKNRAHRGELWLGIEPDYRGNGLGRQLMLTLMNWAATSTQLAWLDLGVFAHNEPARRLYESLGFLEIGRYVDLFRIDGESVDSIEMALDLVQYRAQTRLGV